MRVYAVAAVGDGGSRVHELAAEEELEHRSSW